VERKKGIKKASEKWEINTFIYEYDQEMNFFKTGILQENKM
jgi:hypothetical protein